MHAQTLVDLGQDGCLGSIPVILLLGLTSGVAAGAACLWDVKESASQMHAPLPTEDQPSPEQ